MGRGNDNLIRKAQAVCTNQAKRKIHSLIPREKIFPDFRKAGPQYIQQLLRMTNSKTTTIPLFLLEDNYTTSLGNWFQSSFNFKAKNCFPHLDRIFCGFQFLSISSCPDTEYHCKEPGPIFFTPALMILECSHQSPSQSAHLIRATSISPCS